MERFFHASEERETKAGIGGFWVRIAAWWGDAALLGVVFTFGVIPYFGRYAPEGKLVQCAITLAYFAICDSRWTGGSSFGKMMAGLSVVDRGGRFISPLRALVRASIASVPTMVLAGLAWWHPVPDGTKILIYGVGAGISLASAWLYIFNPQSRQIVHDVLVGTYVVRYDSGELPVEGRTKKRHVVLAALVFGAAAIGLPPSASFVDSQFPAKNPCTMPVRSAVQELSFVDHVLFADVARDPSNPLLTDVIADVRRGDAEQQAYLVAQRVLAACPVIERDGQPLIVALYPRPKGFWRSSAPVFYTGTPADWRAHKARKPSGPDEGPESGK